MKTQLLEDIGESAAAIPLSSRPAGMSSGGKGAPDPAPARDAPSIRPRAATGVWRQRLAVAPPAPTARAPEEAAALELDKVFGELAALEAQFVSPEPQSAPVPTDAATAPHTPFFDFTPPPPAPPVTDPVAPPATGIAQSRKRHLVWAAGALSVALLVWCVGYLVREHHDAGSLALIASQVKAAPRVDPASSERALAARASTIPESTPLPAVPPLVMLEPDPPPATRPAPAARPAVDREEWIAVPKTVRAAKKLPASPVPKPSIRKTRERSRVTAAPAKERRQREPVRQFARAPAVAAERPQQTDTSMAATLKACREHGYHASQCIKRQCSVGAYGFACRGR